MEFIAFRDELLDCLEGYSVADFVYIHYALGEQFELAVVFVFEFVVDEKYVIDVFVDTSLVDDDVVALLDEFVLFFL